MISKARPSETGFGTMTPLGGRGWGSRDWAPVAHEQQWRVTDAEGRQTTKPRPGSQEAMGRWGAGGGKPTSMDGAPEGHVIAARFVIR